MIKHMFLTFKPKKSDIIWFLNWIMKVLGEIDRILYFDKKFDWIWMTADDRTIVFNL
jgi:hypothetical protein